MTQAAHPDLALHSYSRRLRYLHEASYDVFAFLDEAARLGFTGVNLSLSGPDNDRLPPNRHLGGDGPRHLDAVARAVAARGMSLELDTDTVEPGRLAHAIELARRLGAKVVRTFTHHPYGPEIATRTASDLRQALPAAAAADVTIALENHEEFTAPELVAIVAGIDHPNLRLLFDYGNGMPVLEDPVAALDAMRPWVAACHVKDVVMVDADHAPERAPAAAGVALGDGALPLDELTAKLRAGGLARFCLQNVWGYHVPLGKLRPFSVDDPRLGRGLFAYAVPSPDGERVSVDPERSLSAPDLVAAETRALIRATRRFRQLAAGW